MPMVVTARRFTVDEVLAWPDDGNRYELVDGVLLVTPAPLPVHQVVACRIASALGNLIKPWPDVYVTTPGAILIRPGIKLEPDVMVFRAPSLAVKWEEVREHWLAVEVWSPSSVIYDRDIKRDAYLAVGVKEVWLVDPDARTVFVSRPGGPTDVPHQFTRDWKSPATGAALTVDLIEVFRGLE